MTASISKGAAIAAAAALLLAASRADAEFVFCNKFPHLVYVAIAYPQTDGSNSWVSRGWLNIDSGNCAEFDTPLHVTALYYRAESDTYRDQGHS